MNRTVTLSIILVGLGVAVPASAHYTLMDPPNWTNLDSIGSPQKTPPCGNEGSPADNGSITAYKVGQTVNITIKEDITHPGYYRVFLAQNQAGLPADPVPPGAGGDACGGMDPIANPTLPLLSDGNLVHTAAFSGPQTFQVTLPAGMQCDHCVLQVVEYMKNHPQPCFYHHCANISITPNGGGTDAGVNPGPDAGTGGGKSGGGCATTGGAFAGTFALALALGLVVLRRRVR
jgi:uncharacterized protein (TIGR03382 family)